MAVNTKSTRETIAHEALKLFNKHGVNRVGVRQIATHMQISPGNFSYHFPMKEDLLLYILQDMMKQNTAAFISYGNDQDFTMHRWMKLVHILLLNVYQFRGVSLEFAEVSRVLDKEKFNYEQVEKGRLHTYDEIFKGLVKNKQMKLTQDHHLLLLSFMSLYGRLWIAEAFVSFKNKSKTEIIKYYLEFAYRQFSLFVTAEGKRSMEKFRKDFIE